jgi:hydrogenase-4 membrane subunit HyfE
MGNSAASGTPKTPKGATEAAGQEQRTTSWVLPVSTAVVLIAAFCMYYFVYVKAQREYLGNRNFRSLAALGDQLQKMVTIHGSILEFYADMSSTKRHVREPHRERVNLKDILRVRPEDKSLPETAQDREARKDYVRYLAPTFDLADPGTKKLADRTHRLETSRRDGRWVLEFDALPETGEPKDYRGSLVIEELFRPLVESMPFDDILLASDKGEIVYQSKRNGPQFTTLAELLDNQAGSGEKKPAGSPPAAGPKGDGSSIHLTDVVLTGTSYKLFLQPVLIDAFSDDPTQKEERHTWRLCGLRSSASLEWEAMAISYTIIIWLTVFFFAICMGGPILKLFLMNNRERLHLRELGVLGLFLVLLSGVFTLAGLQSAYFHSNDDDTEGRLQQLSENLSKNIHLELRLMRDQLVAMCRTSGLKHDLSAAEKNEIIRQQIASPPDAKAALDMSAAEIKSAAEIAVAAAKYPNFNNAFWTDDDGHQIIKWSPGDYVTPLIDVSGLRIFSEPKMAYLDATGPPLRFDSVLPPNRLEYLVALGMNTKDCNPELGNSGLRGDIAGGQAFLTAQPFSLIDPVLPFGYGFALVEQTGAVLFHIDKTRNMRENFLQESDWNRELLATAFGHSTQGALHIKYLGKDYRARVVPIAGLSQTPWSLVVYRDLTSVRTLDLQSMTMASTLWLIFLAGPCLFIALWCVIKRPHFAPECVWPNQARMATYTYQIALYVLLIVAFVYLGFCVSAEEAVIASAAVPYMALLMTFWCFRMYPAPGEERGRREERSLFPAALSGLTAAVFVLLLVLQWPHSKDLTLLLGVGGIAVFPLLRRPRVYMTRTFKRRYGSNGTGKERLGTATMGPFGYRVCYAVAVLLLLLLIGVLTPMALFRASLSVERRLQVKQAQLHLAAALERHQRSIDDQHEKGDRSDSAAREFFRDGTEWASMGLNPLFTPDGTPSIRDHSTVPGTEIYSNWFRQLIYSLHHDYNESAAEMLGVIPDRAGFTAGDPAPDWTWQNEPAAITLFWHGARPLSRNLPGKAAPPEEHDLVIRTSVQSFSFGDTWISVGIATGVMLAIGGLFWALAQKLFLFQIAPLKLNGQRQLAESLREGRNVLILLPPVWDWQWEEPTWKLDVAALATGPKWAELVDLDSAPKQTLIEVQHMEYTTGDAEIDNQKLLLLERLIHKPDTQVAAVMTVNPSPEDYRRQFPGLDVIDLREEPFPWLAAYEGPARDLIWKECGPLPALWPIGAQLARDIKSETIHSEDTIASEILERADAYYRMIWHECTKEQKFVLAQLAVDGLLNPANGRAVRQLVRRGLIAKDPQFRIMNESFRRFLRSAATPDLKQEWMHQSRQSGWGKAHGVFFTTMLLIGIFLLTTQNELWQSSAGYVTTALGAFGTLAKLLNTVRGGGTAEKPSS